MAPRNSLFSGKRVSSATVAAVASGEGVARARHKHPAILYCTLRVNFELSSDGRGTRRYRRKMTTVWYRRKTATAIPKEKRRRRYRRKPTAAIPTENDRRNMTKVIPTGNDDGVLPTGNDDGDIDGKRRWRYRQKLMDGNMAKVIPTENDDGDDTGRKGTTQMPTENEDSDRCRRRDNMDCANLPTPC